MVRSIYKMMEKAFSKTGVHSNSMYEWEAHTVGEDAITKAVDTITIKNIANRTMGSVQIILPKELARVFHIDNNTFQTIEPGKNVTANLTFKATMLEKKEQFMQNYNGELTIVSEHDNLRKIPIKIVWNYVESEHFTVYARHGDEAIAKKVIETLEDNYQNITLRFGTMRTKTVLYLTGSMDEMNIVNPSGKPYYSYTDDTIFVCACDEPEHNALKQFVYRLIINNHVSYHNIKKFVHDQENWLMDGITSYIVANITNAMPEYIDAFTWSGPLFLRTLFPSFYRYF